MNSDKKIEVKKIKNNIVNLIICIICLIIIVALSLKIVNNKIDKNASEISNEEVVDHSVEFESALKDMRDGDYFYVAGQFTYSFDKLYVVIDDLTREEICSMIGIDDDAIVDKPEGYFEMFTVKNNRVNAMISGPIDEVKMNFRKTDGVSYNIYELTQNDYHFWNVEIDENGVYNFYY